MKNPFTGVRFARLELNNFQASTMMKLAIIAVACIPLIYAGLFLLAFLDPYGSLNQVPAAIVNLDAGAEVNGEQRNLGQELCDELVKNNEEAEPGEASGFDWKFTDAADAREGLENATYYMEMTIPENFSENVASADSDSPESAELQVYFNPSTNLIAQTVGSSMVTKIRAELNEKIDEEYFDNIFVKISDAADQLQDAVDGTDELADGMDELQDGSSTLTDGIETAQDGSSDLSDGLDKLESGSSTLTNGLKSAKKGSKSLADGVESAQKGSKKITKNLGTLADGAKSVDKGVGTLSTNLKALKDGIASAQSSTADLSTVITGVGNALTAYETLSKEKDFATNETKQKEAQGYLTTATDLAEKAKEANPTIGKDLYTYVTGLTSALSDYSSAATVSAQAKATMGEKKTAMDNAKEEMEKKAVSDETTKALTEKANSFSGDLTNLYAAIKTFESDPTKAADLASKASTVVTNGSTLLTNFSSFSTALKTYQTKASGYQSAANDYQTAAATYQEKATAEATAAAAASEAKGQVTGYLMGVKNTSAVASDSTGTVASAIDQLYTAVSGTLKSGTSQVASGASKLESGSSTLTKGLKTASKGAKSLSSGISSAESGSSTITYNLGTAADGADDLTDGLSDAADGSQQITDGLATASDGVDELHDGIADGQDQMKDNAANSDVKSSMMSSPVTANGSSQTGEKITEVSNYGTGFAPYFIALGLWVGALMISMVMHCLSNRILMSDASSFAAVLAGYIPMALVSIVQVIMLLLVIQFGLQMHVQYPLAFYLFGLLVSLCFVAIVQFFRATLGTVGLVVVVVLLMLQLCTAAGTFPIEAELPIFNWLNPFLPMTYVVHGFRMAMAGLSASYMLQDVLVLLAFTVAFLAFTTIFAHKRRNVSMTQLYKPLKLAE